MTYTASLFDSECILAPDLSYEDLRAETPALNTETFRFLEKYNIEINCWSQIEDIHSCIPRRELKLMRKESFVANVCMSKIFKRSKEILSSVNSEEIGLIVSCGFSLGQYGEVFDQLIDLLNKNFEKKENRLSVSEQLNRNLYPLFALKALSNACQSNISQNFNILGPGYTLGNGPLSSYSALKGGLQWLHSGQCKVVFLLALNSAGLYSASNLLQHFSSDKITESSGVSILGLCRSDIILGKKRNLPNISLFESKTPESDTTFHSHYPFLKGASEQIKRVKTPLNTDTLKNIGYCGPVEPYILSQYAADFYQQYNKSSLVEFSDIFSTKSMFAKIGSTP